MCPQCALGGERALLAARAPSLGHKDAFGVSQALLDEWSLRPQPFFPGVDFIVFPVLSLHHLFLGCWVLTISWGVFIPEGNITAWQDSKQLVREPTLVPKLAPTHAWKCFLLICRSLYVLCLTFLSFKICSCVTPSGTAKKMGVKHLDNFYPRCKTWEWFCRHCWWLIFLGLENWLLSDSSV